MGVEPARGVHKIKAQGPSEGPMWPWQSQDRGSVSEKRGFNSKQWAKRPIGPMCSHQREKERHRCGVMHFHSTSKPELVHQNSEPRRSGNRLGRRRGSKHSQIYAV